MMVENMRIGNGIDINGVVYVVDYAALAKKFRNTSDGRMSSLIEEGVRQFLGLSDMPTPQMISFLRDAGVIVKYDKSSEPERLNESDKNS